MPGLGQCSAKLLLQYKSGMIGTDSKFHNNPSFVRVQKSIIFLYSELLIFKADPGAPGADLVTPEFLRAWVPQVRTPACYLNSAWDTTNLLLKHGLRARRNILRRESKFLHHRSHRRRRSKAIQPNHVAIQAHILPPARGCSSFYSDARHALQQHARFVLSWLRVKNLRARHAHYAHANAFARKQLRRIN